MKKILVVVDMQKDFVTGALKNEMAEKIIPTVKKKIEDAYKNEDIVVFTKDTHDKKYKTTEEGKNLPVEHCIKGTEGWDIVDELKDLASKAQRCILKNTFGSCDLGLYCADLYIKNKINSIELIGICTDICVLSNATIIKAYVPNIPIYVDASCCAGVTEESHDIALKAMQGIHIHVQNEGKELWRN